VPSHANGVSVTAAAPLYVEAMVHLVAARLAVATLPFARLMALLRPDDGQRGARLDGVDQDCARRIRSAVRSVARTPSLWVTCLPQALAAHWMLGRRGISSRIGFGVRRGPKGLCSHAWLVCGNETLLGGECESEFSLVGEFPIPRQKEDQTCR
jgi:hypothetical protein